MADWITFRAGIKLYFATELADYWRARAYGWHLDEMVCRVGGKRMHLWRAVDADGEVLDMIMRPYRDSWVATKDIAYLIVNSPVYPERITTDGFLFYPTACHLLKIGRVHRRGRLRENNRAENSHLPI